MSLDIMQKETSLCREQSRKVLLKIGYECNNNCLFCHSLHLRNTVPQLALEEAKAKIRQAKERGAEMVVFSGGEPTLHREIFDLLHLATTYGLKTGIVTNGRMFFYKDFVRDILRYSLKFVYISLHGAMKKTHNKIVGNSSFHQTVEGIKNLERTDTFRTVNMVINRYNVNEIDQMVALLSPFSLRLKFSLMEPKGSALEHFADLAVNPRIAADEVVHVAKNYTRTKRGKITDIGCDGFTPCLIESFDMLNMDLFTDNFIAMSEADEEDLFDVDHGKRSFTAECNGCAKKGNCPGIYVEYMEMFQKFLKPFPAGRPNSFFYVPMTHQTINVSSNACPLDYNVNGYYADREVFLKMDNQFKLYRTETQDFSDEEIQQVKERGQLYLNLSGKVCNLNYEQDLQKMTLSKSCAGCRYRQRCPQIFEAVTDNVFTRFDSLIRGKLKRLRGEVCDVGCGDMRYVSVLRDLIDTGVIQYTGLDPRKTVLKDSSLTYVCCAVEDYDTPPEYFDHVLVLRSYNHLRDLDKAFAVISRMLKPGGYLLIVEGVPFGVLREKKARLPYRTKPSFEHFQNHSLKDALSFFDDLPFIVIQHRDVSVDGCNEWFLMLKKRKQ